MWVRVAELLVVSVRWNPPVRGTVLVLVPGIVFVFVIG